MYKIKMVLKVLTKDINIPKLLSEINIVHGIKKV